jgi:hypothetical protein
MSTVASDFATITKWAGDNDKQIIGQMLNGLDFVNDVDIRRNVSSHGILLPKMVVNGGNRPLNTDVTAPKGTNRSFSGRKLFVNPGMKIIRVIAEEARKTFMDRGLDPKAKDIPFAQWIWEQEFNKIQSDLNDNIYLSVSQGTAAAYASGTAYTAGQYMTYTDNSVYKCVTTTTAGQTPVSHPAKWVEVDDMVISEGWGTIIAREVAASALPVTTTGAIDNTNALDKLELIYNDMTVAHRKKGGVFLLAPDVYRDYLAHEKAVYPYVLNQDMGDGKKYIYGSGKKWEIKEASWMGDSGRVIATQKTNLVFGTYMQDDGNKIANIVPTLHGYDAIVKWLQGCEICDLETLYVNDQA